jgi:hypothetical protein
MRDVVTSIVIRSFVVAVGILAFAAPPAQALDTSIPSTGLPSAAVYSSTLLPELNGVVSWKTLAQVEPVKQGDKVVPQFSRDILGLDAKPARVQGFILPLDMGDQQQHFLLSAVPPHCPFCMPAGPDAIVEVIAKKRIEYRIEPIVMSGKFAVLKDDPSGVLYRLTEAEPIPSKPK